jgi:hypothetical protein
MASIHRLDITVQDAAQSVLDQLRWEGSGASAPRDINLLGEWLVGRAAGTQGTGITIAAKMGAVQATATVTLTSHVATDTVTVCGIVFTCVASGATGNQYNVGGTDTLTAVNLAAAINASVTAGIAGVVTATSALTVVTLTATAPGRSGNGYTLAISAHGSVSGSGRFTSGSDGTGYTLQRG